MTAIPLCAHRDEYDCERPPSLPPVLPLRAASASSGLAVSRTITTATSARGCIRGLKIRCNKSVPRRAVGVSMGWCRISSIVARAREAARAGRTAEMRVRPIMGGAKPAHCGAKMKPRSSAPFIMLAVADTAVSKMPARCGRGPWWRER